MPINDTQHFALRSDYITLGQLLKMTGTISTGGEAKFYLAETPVIVNGDPEQRRGRKLRPGDCVNIDGGLTITLSSTAPAEASF